MKHIMITVPVFILIKLQKHKRAWYQIQTFEEKTNNLST